MEKRELTVGFAITGSFCTYDKVRGAVKELTEMGMKVIPIFSNQAQCVNCRFGDSHEFVKEMEQITGNKAILTIPEAEPIGPKGYLDILVIAPCTGNTLAKLSTGITDSPVLMAAKAHLRNEKPLVISISTNDALGMNFKNIGNLFNCKHIYFVPFGQDNYEKKPNSMIAHVELIPETIEKALLEQQIQPVLRSKFKMS